MKMTNRDYLFSLYPDMMNEVLALMSDTSDEAALMDLVGRFQEETGLTDMDGDAMMVFLDEERVPGAWEPNDTYARVMTDSKLSPDAYIECRMIMDDADGSSGVQAAQHDAMTRDIVLRMGAIMGDGVSGGVPDELLEQRTVLFACLCNSHPQISFKLRKHGSLGEPGGDGCFVAGIETPGGCVTCRCKNEFWDLFRVNAYDVAPVLGDLPLERGLDRLRDTDWNAVMLRSFITSGASGGE